MDNPKIRIFGFLGLNGMTLYPCFVRAVDFASLLMSSGVSVLTISSFVAVVLRFLTFMLCWAGLNMLAIAFSG